MKIFLIGKPEDSGVSIGTLAAMFTAAGHDADTLYTDKLREWRDDPPRDDYGHVVPLDDFFYSLLAQPAYEELVQHISVADAVVFIVEANDKPGWDQYTDAWVFAGIAVGLKKPVYAYHETGRKIGVARRAVKWYPSVEKLIQAVDKGVGPAAPPPGQWKQD